MISVSEAKQVIQDNVEALAPVTVPLQDTSGLILAEHIISPIDLPAFNQSGMDGYAFAYDDYTAGKELVITGEVQAGVYKSFNGLSQQAFRIFTGAPVPAGTDTVVMQEKVTVRDKLLSIHDQQIQKGTNVRSIGAEIGSGEMALQKGTFLSAAAIGFVAGLGVSEVKVFPKPAVTIIVTGKELQQPGNRLQLGQVYDSNSFMLRAALRQLHINNAETIFADDNIDILQKALEKSLETSDLVLLTGGVSVGDYDFVLQAAELCRVEKMFHKVKQRPGKPMFFGIKNEKAIFGLPGNPSSVLTCFYEYVIPAIEKMTMQKGIIKKEFYALGEYYNKKTALTHFLKGRKEGNTVFPLNAQESFRLSSFARADCLIYLPEDKEEFKQGELVEIHLLPL